MSQPSSRPPSRPRSLGQPVRRPRPTSWRCPRIGALALSADGTRLAVSVQTLDPEKKKWQSALWEVDPAGQRPARRLTRSAPGESRRCGRRTARCCSPPPGPTPARRRTGTPSRRCGACPPTAARPGWCSPGRAGSPRSRSPPTAATWSWRPRRCPAARPPRPTRSGASKRKDAGVTAVLHESYPVRLLGPRPRPGRPRTCSGPGSCPPRSPPRGADAVELRDLTPDAAPPAGAGEDFALSPDGGCWPGPRR